VDHQDEERAGGETAQRAELEEAAVEATPAVGRVLGHEGRRATVLTAGGEALDDAQQHEQQRRPEPDRLVRRDRAEQHRRTTHQKDGERQDLTTANRSPSGPHTKPPRGRMMKETAKTPSVSSVADSRSPGKNESAM